MTVLVLLSSSGLGGRELNTIRLIPYLRARGVAVIAAVLDSGGFVSEKCAAAGIDVHCLGLWPSRLNILVVFWRFFILLVRKRPHLIQVYGFQASMICRFAALPLRIKVVVGIVGNGHFTGFRPLVEGLTSRLVSHYTTNSLAAKERLLQVIGGRVQDITVIYNGVPEFAVPGNKGPGKCFVSGTVGNLRPEKGYDVLLQALALAKTKLDGGVNWKHLIAGEGELREMLTAMIADLGLTGQVFLLGRVDDVVGFLGRLDVFVLSSYTEGLPNAMLEAMMAGRCVIATKAGGIPEVVAEGDNGLLVNPGDAENLSRALLAVFENPQWREKMAVRGRDTVLAKFTLQRQAEETVKTWQGVSYLNVKEVSR